jgi:hypothetical protein
MKTPWLMAAAIAGGAQRIERTLIGYWFLDENGFGYPGLQDDMGNLFVPRRTCGIAFLRAKAETL